MQSLAKLWALYTAGHAAAKIEQRLTRSGPLRVDWLAPAMPNLGITLLPGRRDYDRDLTADVSALKAAGVTHVLSLVTPDELAARGAESLADAVSAAGLTHRLDALLDQRGTTPEQMDPIAQWLDAALASAWSNVMSSADQARATRSTAQNVPTTYPSVDRNGNPAHFGLVLDIKTFDD